MRNFILTLSFGLFVFCTSSCLNENSGNSSAQYYETMAKVTQTGSFPSFKTDDGITLYSAVAVSSKISDSIKLGDRLFLQFSYGDTTSITANNYPIAINGYGTVTIKDFVTVGVDSTDTYENQQLQGADLFWITKNYFNLVFRTYLSLSAINTYELVRMKGNESNALTDTVPKIYFELRHNTPAVNINYYNIKIFSFDLSPLYKEFPKATKFQLNLKWALEGTHAANYVYVPDTTLDSSSSLERKRQESIMKLSSFPVGAYNATLPVTQ
jgi:hypothetical protein